MLVQYNCFGMKTMRTDCSLLKLVGNYDGKTYLTDLCNLLGVNGCCLGVKKQQLYG